MRLQNQLAITVCFLLTGLAAQAQLKDMPSQAEFDPILENANTKVKDFLSTLGKYHAEATEIDRERLETDLHDFQQLRELIGSAHSGSGNHGINLTRIVGILAGLDDAAMEAAVWSNLISARVCTTPRLALLNFALAVQTNGGMLREVGNQLFHPAFRMASGADEIILAFADAASKPPTKAPQKQ